MKGWAVSRGEYSDYSVLAVFTDIEKAKLFCVLNHSNWYPPFIEEMEIDPDIEGDATGYSYVRYAYVTKRWGIKLENAISIVKSTDEPVRLVKNENGSSKKYRVTSQKPLTDELTIKLMSDYLAKKNAEREGI